MSQTQEDVAEGIASRVRAARTGRRWTLDELAARSGVSRRMLVQIEHAGANPSLATLLKLAAALDITLTDLVSEQPDDEPVAVVSGHDARTLWSTPAGSSARLIVGHGPLELWSWTLACGDRRAGDVSVGSRHDDRASGHRIIAAIVLTRRQNVTRQRSGQDTGGKKCERVRKGRASHARGS